MTSQDIVVPTVIGEISAYESIPVSGSAVGVIVISAIFGNDDDTKKICDDLATEGFPAAAINMFCRDELDRGPLSINDYDRAIARSKRLDRDDGNIYVKASIDYLKSSEYCNGKIAVFGFCYGGPYVIEAAAQHWIDGGISFHGSYIENFLFEFEHVRCPMEFHYGDNDSVAPIGAIKQVQIECEKLDDAKLYIYPGGEHGYMFPNRGSGYQAEAAQLSWNHAIKFLNRL